MPTTLALTPEERQPFAYLLAYEVGQLSRGTREHRDAAEGLREVYDDLLSAPDGPIELAFNNDEIYYLGLHAFADATELEDWWLDNRASMRQSDEPAPFPDDVFGEAVTRHIPEAVQNPVNWNYTDVQPIFLELGFKIDRSLTAGAPRVRGIYQKEKTAILRATLQAQAERAARRGRIYSRDGETEAWRRAAREGDVADGEMADIELAGRHIVLANVSGDYYAVDALCPHVPRLSALTNLANGSLDTEKMCVTCPWHGAQYSIRSGRVVRPPYADDFKKDHLVAGRVLGVLDPKKTTNDIRAYRTKVEDGFVWVDLV